MAQRTHITFDAPGDSAYVVNGGIQSGGNPGNCLVHRSAAGPKARINFSYPVRLTFVSVNARKQRYAGKVSIRAYNGSWITIINSDVGTSWGTYAVNPLTFTPIQNVTAVEYRLGDGSSTTYYLDNCIADYIPQAIPLVPPVGDNHCILPASADPIRLDNGEKQEQVTDLVVHSVAEPLTFARTYRQYKHADWQFMGLGWSHNHDAAVLDPSPDINKGAIAVRMSGGLSYFNETSPGSAIYRDVESISEITLNGASQYVLRDGSQTTWLFDSSGKVLEKAWPNGEKWTYHYYSSGTYSGLLEYVDDGYGRELHLAWTTLAWFGTPQLWRVGDQDATGLDGGSLSGRYVEFSYVKQQDDGSDVVSSPLPLLAAVRDVRGEDWMYRYYGSESGEYQADDQADYLVDEVAPDGSIVKHLTYTFNSGDLTAITEALGGDGTQFLETIDFDFQTNRTIETKAGKEITHHFLNGVYVGAQDGLGNRPETYHNTKYRPSHQFDANGNPTRLTWSGDGNNLTKVTDALNKETTFIYNADNTLQQATDAQGRKTTYLYNPGSRQPVLILVGATGTEIALNGSMEADSGWTNVGTPTTNERSDTQVDSGAYARHVVTGAAAEGIQSTNWTMIAGRTYVLKARVYPVTSHAIAQVKLKVSGMTEFDMISKGESAWETLRAVYTPTVGGTKQVQFLAEGAACEFYVDSLHLVDVTNLLHWQEFIQDDKGRILSEAMIAVDTGQISQQTTRVYGTVGSSNGLLESQTQVDVENAGNNISMTYTYDGAGRVVKTQKSSLFGSCEFSYTVYDAAGNVVATVCGRESVTIPTTVAEARSLYDSNDPSRFTVTTHEYDALGRRIQTTTNDGSPAPAAAVTTVTVYDERNRVIRTVANYVDDSYNPPADWVFEGGDWKDEVGGTTIAHGNLNDQNIINDTEYNERGRVRLQRDVLGNVTLLGYNDADRLVKSIRSASDPTYNNDYSGTGSDPDLSEYSNNANPDEDIVTSSIYDAAGNLVQTIDPLGISHFTVYDARNRPVKRVRSAKTTATVALKPGVVGYNATLDPRSPSYVVSTAPDRDLIDTTEYDALGRVISTGDVNGSKTRTVYDNLGRVAKTIANYKVQGTTDPANWIWDATDARWERDATGNVAVEHGTNHDENIITETVYDSQGRVSFTRDVLGRRSLSVYDGLGRVVRRISNYVPQGSSDPADWEWDAGDQRWEDGAGNAIARGSSDDQNIVTDTVYDNEGRVQQSIDVRQNATHQVYDESGRQVMTIGNFADDNYNDPDQWYWDGAAGVWKDNGTTEQTISHGNDNDENIIARTDYDAVGRVSATRDVAGIETRFAYDNLGRRIKTIHNYVDGIFSPSAPDEDLIAETTYNPAGQVVETLDMRGTKTAFTYDAAGRRLTLTQAADTPLAVTSYTCYDKAGRVRRTIQNWDGTGNPDAQDVNGNWTFAPTVHGANHDQNRITEYFYDAANRQVKVVDPAGSIVETAYFKDGQVNTTTQKGVMVNSVAADVLTAYRYDDLRRRRLVVQNFVGNGEDPANWVWDAGDTRYEKSDGTAIVHGTNNDQNIIVQVAYDVVGRMLNRRDPRGYVTSYTYDQLNRRLSLSNPLSTVWLTSYDDLANGGTRTTQTFPGLASGGAYGVQRDFDRMGRLSSIDYGAAVTTPIVTFAYDNAGNRTQMTENDGTSDIRKTMYTYDDARRLTQVGFDTDGDSNVDESVSYAYDAGGLRTKLTLPGALDVVYEYDDKGRLIGLTDWDGQHSELVYDEADRHIETRRSNSLLSDYRYDTAGRLLRIRHLANESLRGQFEYAVDARGNRTQVDEKVAASTSVAATYDKSAAEVSYTTGTWSDSGDFKTTSDTSATMEVDYTAVEARLMMGVGPDHGKFDLYIGGNLWQTFDGYAAAAGEHVIHVPEVESSEVLEIRNRADHNPLSTGDVLRFKQVEAWNVSYDEHVIDYTYDALSRLLEADYDSGTTVYTYGYDRAGNLVDMDSVNRTYNAANQLVNDGTNSLSYDANGNLTSDGVNSYTWDRANRMLTASGSTSYAYDGLGNRIQQTVSSIVTDYLLDVQPGLVKVLAQTEGSDTTRYIHSPRGIHAQEDNMGVWSWMLQDGLGSVRGFIDASLGVNAVQSYDPYGNPDGSYSAGFGFTGEQTDSNGQVYLRARYYNPGIGVFPSLDPFEGVIQRPMSLNGYTWVEGNVPNATDPDGRTKLLADTLNASFCSPNMQIEQTGCHCTQIGFIRVCSLDCIIPVPRIPDIDFPDIQLPKINLPDSVEDLIPILVGPITGPAILNAVTDNADYDALDQDHSIPKKFPNQRCSEKLRLQLQDEIDNQWCNQQRSCTDVTLDCSELALRISWNDLCLKARELMKSRCFPTDPSHDNEIQTVKGVSNTCYEEFFRRCGPNRK